MHFKKLVVLCFFINLNCSDVVQLNIKPEHHEKMNLLLTLINPSDNLKCIASLIKSDLEFADQFQVKIWNVKEVPSKSKIKKLEKFGYSLILFINEIIQNKLNGIAWRIYDSSQACMLKGKKVFLKKFNQNIAHSVSNQIFEELTGQKGCFCSVIAAVKNAKAKNHKKSTSIFAIHPSKVLNGLDKPKLIINESSICISPRWNSNKPLLYYSKQTPFNLRLMSVDCNGKTSIVSNFDGLNMTPSISDDHKIILTITRNGKERICKYEFDKSKQKGKFVSITDKNLNAICPSFINEQKLVLCVIDKLHRPRIAILNLNDDSIENITNFNEYCVSPSYCKINNKIAYCKRVAGYQQVFTYDLSDKTHSQLTTDKGDKDSPSWSCCGNFIVYSNQINKSSQIDIINLLNKIVKHVTPANEHWSCPSWSNNYDEIPFYSTSP